MTDEQKRQEDARQRARKIIGYFQGFHNEFDMLKGVLCAYHSWSYEDTQAYRALIDTGLIAERMDELQKKALADFQRQQFVDQRAIKEGC